MTWELDIRSGDRCLNSGGEAEQEVRCVWGEVRNREMGGGGEREQRGVGEEGEEKDRNELGGTHCHLTEGAKGG